MIDVEFGTLILEEMFRITAMPAGSLIYGNFPAVNLGLSMACLPQKFAFL